MVRGEQSDEVARGFRDVPGIAEMGDGANVTEIGNVMKMIGDNSSKDFTKSGHMREVRQTSKKLISSP
jgi:hypothetical protein